MSSHDRQVGYLSIHATMLAELKAMWEDPKVQLYGDTEFPNDTSEGSVFLAGPTSRNQILKYQWRAQAVALLRYYGFKGWIFCPEPRGLEAAGDFTEKKYIHHWESERLWRAERVMFWIPRKADELLGLNTNLELGMCLGRVIFNSPSRRHLFVGWPDEAERMGLPKHYMDEVIVQRYSSLPSLCADVANSKY